MSVHSYPKGFGGGADQELREEVRKLSEKVDNLVARLGDNIDVQRTSRPFQGEDWPFYLNSASNLIWWSKVERAARYCITLTMPSMRLSEPKIYVDRDIRFYVFDKISMTNSEVFAKVTAEDRDGKAIASASVKLFYRSN